MPVNPISYDELPYTCRAMPYAQPGRLATLATLFGMTPPPIHRCRVLELGCCNGNNIIATAYHLPQAECVGIDISAQSLAQGQALINVLGLKNISLKQLDIAEVNKDLGMFDYIIAHGIFSWVSHPVQEKIFGICQQHLVPQGIAYISYSTQPGNKIREVIREMMRYYTALPLTSEQKEEQLRALLRFLHETTAESQDAYDQLLHEEVKSLGKLPASFVFHEWLEEEHTPIYFHQFIQRARSHSLAYLADAFLPTMLTSNFSPAIAKKLQIFKNDLIYQEQAMDILHNRHFRHTLLCHQGTKLNREISANSIKNFHVASSLQPVPDHLDQFKNSKGSLNSSHPVVQEAIRYLGMHWPSTVSWNHLVHHTSQKIKNPEEPHDNTIATALLVAYSKGLIELHLHPLSCTKTISDYPKASQLARQQIQQGHQVTNLRCESVVIQDVLCSHLLSYLDGTHHQNALLDLFHRWIKQGTLNIQIEQQPEQSLNLSEEALRDVLQQLLENALQHLVYYALLES